MPVATTAETEAEAMPKLNQAELDWLLDHNDPGGQRGPERDDWYRIEAAKKGARGKKTASVYIMDEISPWGSGARAFAQNVASLDVDQIDLHINSPGGSFPEGVAIMNMLKGHKATVTATVEGMAASAATIVVMGADSVVMAKGSQMMIHEGSGLVYGPMADMLKMAQLLEKTNSQMAEIYVDKAGGTPEKWREAMNEETWYTDAEAVEAGLADRVGSTASEGEVVAARTKWDLTVFAHAGRDSAPAPYNPAADPPDQEEDEEMPNKTLVSVATALGVKDADKFADDEKLSEAITALKLAPVEDKPADTPGDKPADKPGPGVKIPDGFVLLDKDTVEALQTTAKGADAALARIEERERDAELDAAVVKGKIPNARRDHWVTFWKSDPEGAKAALAALPDNLVPLAPIGSGGGAEDQELDADYRALYPEESGLNG